MLWSLFFLDLMGIDTISKEISSTELSARSVTGYLMSIRVIMMVQTKILN
jgi:hypothetical protein